MTTPVLNAGGSREAAGALRQIGAALRVLVRVPGLRVLIVCNAVLGMSASFVLPYMSLFGTREVGMSLGLFGVFMTANALAGIALTTWLAHVSDTKSSRKAMLLVGSAAGALGYLGYAFVRAPWILFLIGGGAIGISALSFSQLFALAREHVDRSDVPKSDMPLVMNAFRTTFAVSWTFGPALAAFVLKKFSFVGLFGAASLLYFVLFVLTASFVHAGSRAGGTSPVTGPGLFETLRRGGVAFWFFGLALMYAAHTMSMSNMSLLVLRELGGDEAQVGVIFSLAPLFELPLMLTAGLIATRVPTRRLIRGAMLLGVFYYVALASVRSATEIYALQVASAAIISVTSGIAITFFQDLIPERLGSATNLYTSASRIGGTSSYLAFGLVASRFGHRGTAVACALFALTALGLSAIAGVREAGTARAGSTPD